MMIFHSTNQTPAMTTPTPHTIKIGGASGFWGDSSLGTEQLLQVPGIQYITYDYLAELTMAIMAGMRMKNPEHGYALDFIDLMKKALPVAKSRGIKIVANAGGLNPAACAAALQKTMDELGQSVRIGVVSGDDATATLGQLRKQGVELKDASEKLGIKFTVLAQDPAELFELPRSEALPVTYIIDNKGKVREQLMGEQTAATAAAPNIPIDKIPMAKSP